MKKEAVFLTKRLYRGLGWPTVFTHIRFFTAPYVQLEKLIPPKGLIIDLGCGYGIFSNFLGLTGPKREILGIEFDGGKIDLADRGVENVKFLRADITKIKVKKAKAILLVHVLHHLNSFEEQERLIKKCGAKLKKDGQVFIVEVDQQPKWKYLLGWLADHLLYCGNKIYYRFPHQYLSLFTKLGFRVKIIRADKDKPFAHLIYVLRKND